MQLRWRVRCSVLVVLKFPRLEAAYVYFVEDISVIIYTKRFVSFEILNNNQI